MKIKNTCKHYDIKTIRRALKLATPPGVTSYNLSCQNTEKGCAYGRAIGKTWIGIRVGRLSFPYKTYGCYKKNKGYLPIVLYDYAEVLIHLLAHELRHLWQARHRKGWRVYGSRGRFSERDADAYALHKVRLYRQRKESLK